MLALEYQNNTLTFDHANLKEIANQFGTPTYVYSRSIITNHYEQFTQALDKVAHRICYAVKANSNLAILNVLARLGAGFDIVSLGELQRVIKACGHAQKVVFSGVGKSAAEIKTAILANIFCFNVESHAEILLINHIALKLQRKVNIALRINPDINAETHTHITTGVKDSKFGIPIPDALKLAREINNLSHVSLIGLACHIGSQLTSLKPFSQAIDQVLALYQQLKNQGMQLTHLNLGGGLGIRYQTENPPTIKEYTNLLLKKISQLPIEIILEPGRILVGNAGVLITRIEYLKSHFHKNFAIVDAGMNDLMRPALYDAQHNILPIELKTGKKCIYDIAGPVCESADFLGKHRALMVDQGDLLAICSTGAYGFSMSSNYNSRLRPAEILLDQGQAYLIRERETFENLYQLEKILPE